MALCTRPMGPKASIGSRGMWPMGPIGSMDGPHGAVAVAVAAVAAVAVAVLVAVAVAVVVASYPAQHGKTSWRNITKPNI